MSRPLAELEQYLVGHWDFENDFLDKSGNGNDGTPTNIEWKPTRRGMKPRFNGANSRINLSSLRTIIGANNFTLSFWSYTYPSGNCFLLGTDGFDSDFGFNVETRDSNARLKISVGNDTPAGISEYSHSTNVFENWALSFDRAGDLTLYRNGVLCGSVDISSYSELSATESILYVGKHGSNDNWDGLSDSVRIYSTALDATEVLALYNSTKEGHGVLYHDRSYTHRLSPDVDSSTVFATDMHTKDGYELVDLSGNGNDGAVYGAVRAGGYFTDGMRFDGADDHIRLPLDTVPGECAISILYRAPSASPADCRIYDRNYVRVDIVSGILSGDIYDTAFRDVSASISWVAGRRYMIDFVYRAGFAGLYVDGVLLDSRTDFTGSVPTAAQVASICAKRDGSTSYAECEMNYVSICSGLSNTANVVSKFNSLAVFHLYEIDFSRYPSNTTVYDSNIPYSSMRVESGSFKIDGGQLTCVTDGIIKMRNAHDFDGSEYVSITVDGVKSSGTTTVTAGTTTASIEQGSNLISIEMDAADVLDKLNIQFREPVE